MSSNVTAVSYGLKLSLPDIQRLRSLLTAAGLSVEAETRTGDGRFEVYAADCALASPNSEAGAAAATAGTITAALLDGPRRALAASSIETVTLKLTPEDLQLLDIDMQWRVVPGDFEIMLGKSSAEIALQGILKVAQ